jgi:hypothetical protein
MRWKVAPAIRQLQQQLDAAFPERLKPDGTIGDAAHSARTSDHNPDQDRIVCAVDVKRLSDEIDSDSLARALVASRDPRIKYVISRGRMWSSYPTRNHPAWAERSYSGPNPHNDHGHLSVTQDGKNSSSQWQCVAALAAPPSQPEQPEQPKGHHVMFIINAKGDNKQYLIQNGGGTYISSTSLLARLEASGVPRHRDEDPAFVASVIKGGQQ